MHEPLTPNGEVALTTVQGSEQHCFYGETVAEEGNYIVHIGAFTFALSGVSRLTEELRTLDAVDTPTAKEAALFLPLDDTMDAEWELLDANAPELSALEFGRSSYTCAVCGEDGFYDDEGVAFIRYIWCHETCLEEFIDGLESVWDHTDDMIEEYL